MSASMRNTELGKGEFRQVPGTEEWYFSLGRGEVDLVFHDIHEVDGVCIFLFSVPHSEVVV